MATGRVPLQDIAILCPAYNSSATIAETLASVQAQDLSRVRTVYVVDDASTDATADVARAAWRAATPIDVVRQPANRGERATVNHAIGAMPAEIAWVLILHSDDLARPHWLSETLRAIESGDQTVGSVCSSWDNLRPDGTVETGEDNPTRGDDIVAGSPAAVRDTLRRGCWWHISGCAIRVAAFEDIGGFAEDLPQMGDWDWLLRCLRRGWAVCYVPRTLIGYRLHGTSVSSRSFSRHRDVSESLIIIRAYAGYLTIADLCRLHADRALSLARRAARAVVDRQPGRAARAVWLLPVVLVNAVASLAACAAGRGRDDVR